MLSRRQLLILAIPSVAALAQNDENSCEGRYSNVVKLIKAPFSDSTLLRVKIDVENFDASDAFRLAVAEVIRAHFVTWIAVDPAAKAELHITGTNLINGDAQFVDVEFGWDAYQIFGSGPNPAMGTGFFKYKGTGAILAGQRSQRVQMVKEMTYRLLSDFEQNDWEKIKKSRP